MAVNQAQTKEERGAAETTGVPAQGMVARGHPPQSPLLNLCPPPPQDS